MSKRFKYFKFDAGAVVALGRDSVKDNTTAVIELVKNSYDADASEVYVEINSHKGFIRICDSGTGMTADEIDENWLRIGFSEKRENKTTNLSNRRKTGEKGIGRLCAYRLGSELTIITKSKKSKDVALFVDWRQFERAGADAEKIKIKVLPERKFIVPKTFSVNKSGTDLIIKDLRETWSRPHIEELRYELSNLTSPFKRVSVNFKIILKTDVAPELDGQIKSNFSQIPRMQFNAEFDGKEFITYKVYESVKSKNKAVKKVIRYAKVRRDQVFESDRELSFAKKTSTGPFSVSMMFFPQVEDYLELVNIKRAALKQFLSVNAGVKIYRDGIKVRPYGDIESPEGDWLGLERRRGRDPAGAGRKTFKIANRQLVGGVFITRDKNINLIDSSSREGLLHEDGYAEMVAITTWCVSQLESYYHESFQKNKRKEEKRFSAEDVNSTIRAIEKNFASFSSKFKKFAKNAPDDLADEYENMAHESEEIHAKLVAAAKEVGHLVSESIVYRVLATMGIASAVFGHETGSYLDQILLSMDAISAELQDDEIDVDSVLEEVNEATEASNIVNAWGKFALSRVNREKRDKRNIDLKNVVEKILKELSPVLEGSGISVDTRISSIEGKYFPMEIESILINLITNAYTACKQKSNNRKILVSLTQRKTKSGLIPVMTVSDSGPGIPKSDIQKIFQPLFTTKVDTKGRPVGTGLGLTIVKSIVDEIGGSLSVDNDPNLKGARFSVELG